MKLLQAGESLDGFVVRAQLHSGAMAHIYHVEYASGAPDPGFRMAMKVPRMATGDGAENIVGFEVESQILQSLSGPHVPQFVAAGDLTRLPYLVMQYIEGKPLQHWLDVAEESGQRPTPTTIAKLGEVVARAVHSLHLQNVVHQDLKPANVMIRPGGDAIGSAVLLDFGLSYHGHFPDLLAEEMRKAVGSPAWMAPEQVVGIRGDPRSDIFAIGVMLYELATGELPFGAPQTNGGLRQRLWMQPKPPRAWDSSIPSWLQEVILRCLEPEAARRYPSAAHLALDLADPEHIQVTAAGEAMTGASVATHIKRWVKAAGMEYRPSPLPSAQIEQAPIVLVALPYRDVSDATLYSLRVAANRALGSRPGARLACLTVIAPGDISSTDEARSESRVHSHHLERQRQWAGGIDLAGRQVSHHVVDDGDAAAAIIRYAQSNHVSVIVMGAATHGLKLQAVKPTIPIKVAMAAPCTVILVKQELPFAMLTEAAEAL
jgi:nucleotide-binding universal stress UspA family protein